MAGQNPPGVAPANAAKGLPPRATPADYQAHAQAGAVTVAAEFAGHSVPTLPATLSTEGYVVVEVGLFGAPHTIISSRDFSLRINAKKSALPAQPYALIFESLIDPEWAPPEPAESKSKTSLGGSGQGQSDPGATPVKPKPPFALQRGWQQDVQKAAMPEGDRQLPAAGLLFFKYGGKEKGIDSVELLYDGPAGKTSLTLHP